MLASASARAVPAVPSRSCCDDANVDSVLVIFIPPDRDQRRGGGDGDRRRARAAPEKPVLATFMSAEGSARRSSAAIPSYPFPESRGDRAGARRRLRRVAPRSRPARSRALGPRRRARARASRRRATLERGGGWLEPAAKPRAPARPSGFPSRRCGSRGRRGGAAAAARASGFPVALKAVGPTILHKTEVGGVRLEPGRRGRGPRGLRRPEDSDSATT